MTFLEFKMVPCDFGIYSYIFFHFNTFHIPKFTNLFVHFYHFNTFSYVPNYLRERREKVTTIRMCLCRTVGLFRGSAFPTQGSGNLGSALAMKNHIKWRIPPGFRRSTEHTKKKAKRIFLHFVGCSFLGKTLLHKHLLRFECGMILYFMQNQENVSTYPIFLRLFYFYFFNFIFSLPFFLFSHWGKSLLFSLGLFSAFRRYCWHFHSKT